MRTEHKNSITDVAEGGKRHTSRRVTTCQGTKQYS